MLNYKKNEFKDIKSNQIYQIKDDYKEALLCLDKEIKNETVEYLKNNKDKAFICLERALDTTKKWNLKHSLGDKLAAV